MNWITKFIKPKIKSLFEKKSSKIEGNLWTTCSCKNLIYKEDLESNQNVCPKCGEHHKLTCIERFQTFFDNKEFELIEIQGKEYFTNNEVGGEIYSCVDDDIGEKVGYFDKNGIAHFNK